MSEQRDQDQPYHQKKIGIFFLAGATVESFVRHDRN